MFGPEDPVCVECDGAADDSTEVLGVCDPVEHDDQRGVGCKYVVQPENQEVRSYGDNALVGHTAGHAIESCALGSVDGDAIGFAC